MSVAKIASAALLGGIAGSACRQLLILSIVAAGGSDVSGRMVVNVVGGFLAGVFLARREAAPQRLGPLEPLIAAGFLGGFTTVAGYSLDAVRAFDSPDWPTLLAVIAVDGAIGLLAAACGHRLARDRTSPAR